jgi:hypothetical protein
MLVLETMINFPVGLLPSVIASSLVYAFEGAYPDPALNITCLPQPLEVFFPTLRDSQRYTSDMLCGNLFLRPDVQEQPVVIFHEADPNSLYTLLMIDPDDEIPKSINHGNWPGPPGKFAPCRHWTIGNIEGGILQKGYGPTADGAEWIGQSYHGPGISYGTHRYGLFLFKQRQGSINFSPLDPNRCPWNYESELIKLYSLGNPVASNFMIVLHYSNPYNVSSSQSVDWVVNNT